jgi:hypothetical protein
MNAVLYSNARVLHMVDAPPLTFLRAVNPSKVKASKHKNFNGTDEELTAIFVYLLHRKLPSDPSIVGGAELAAVVDDDFCTVRIRKNLSGIRQQVASFSMPRDPDEADTPLFDWNAESCEALDTVTVSILSGCARGAAADAVSPGTTTHE